MTNKVSIRSSKDLRTNYSQISILSRKNPVVITVNGKKDAVLISHNYFVKQQKYISELEAKLFVYNHLSQSVDDLKLGRLQNIEEAFDDVIKEFKVNSIVNSNERVLVTSTKSIDKNKPNKRKKSL